MLLMMVIMMQQVVLMLTIQQVLIMMFISTNKHYDSVRLNTLINIKSQHKQCKKY
jgi:hypothetical protein